jgi:prefoldin subunit 5
MEVPKGLQALPKQVTSLLGDVGKIAERMQSLPGMLEALKNIEARVENLDREVVEMHHAVERLDERVTDLQGTLHPFRRKAPKP